MCIRDRLEEQKTLWWCRDGGLAQASSKIVRVALDRGGRAACATDDGTIYALAPHLRGAAREWRCVAQTKTDVPSVETWLAFDCARDGRVLVATAHGLHVFAPALANEEAVEDHGLSLKAAALSNSGACLAASSENRLVAWRRDESWKPVALHHDCNRGYTDLRWAEEGRERLLCVSEDGAVRVLALERKGRDGPLALEPFCQMREPGPSLVSATWAPSADDGTARVCVTRETDDGLAVLTAGSADCQVARAADVGVGAAAGVHGGGGEGFPDDALALVRGDEQRDARAEAVALRQQLVQADHDDARHEELQDDQDGVPGAELAHVAVDAGHDVRHSLTDGDQNTEELLRAVTAS